MTCKVFPKRSFVTSSRETTAMDASNPVAADLLRSRDPLAQRLVTPSDTSAVSGVSWAAIVAGAAGAAFGPAYAYIADITPPEQRAKRFGLLGAAFGAGFVLGPAIGGLLGELGPRAPFFVAALCALANFCFGFFALPETLDAAHRRPFDPRRANPVGTLTQMRKYPAVFGLLGAVFLWQLGHQVLPATWSFYTMFKFGWSPAAVGGSLAAVGLIMAFSQGFLTGRIGAALAECEARGVRGGAIYDLLHLLAARKAGAEVVMTLDARHFQALSRRGDPRIETP